MKSTRRSGAFQSTTWLHPEPDRRHPAGRVLVGDVFHQSELSRRVLAWLRQLHARGAEIRIGDPGRSFLPMDLLECVATFTVPPVPAWDSVVDRHARVWRLSPSPPEGGEDRGEG